MGHLPLWLVAMVSNLELVLDPGIYLGSGLGKLVLVGQLRLLVTNVV